MKCKDSSKSEVYLTFERSNFVRYFDSHLIFSNFILTFDSTIDVTGFTDVVGV
jgi:hypothetical protein